MSSLLRDPALAGLLVLCGLLAGCDGSASAEPEAGREPLVVRRGDLAPKMFLTGELVAEDAVALTTPNANIWPMTIRWLAEDGAEVGEGDPVVEFDNSQLTADLEDLKARVIETESQLDSRRARLAGEVSAAGFEVEEKRAAMDKARLDAEVPRGLHAQREYERQQLELRRAELLFHEAERQLATTREAGEADVEIQRVALRKIETELARAESGIELLSLRAPRDGIFLVNSSPMEGRPFQNGDASWPGITVGRLPDLSTLVVHARLYDVDDGRVSVGQEVEASLDAFPDRTFQGRIREIDGVAQEESSESLRRSFRTTIDLDELDLERMRPGMSVKIVIRAEPLREVLLVPRAAVELAETPRVRLAGGAEVEVTLGPCDAMACVLEEGPDDGTKLAYR